LGDDSLAECLGVKTRDVVVFHCKSNLNGLAADFAVFDIALTADGEIEDHGNLFAAVGASKRVLH
jgi:hypothetical protein